MLEHLHISNLALIEDMSLDFEEGLNVLTGETGAGKSFILKALGFVLGDKLGSDIVRPGADRARVEAIFQQNGKEMLLRRELMANSGRSRFYINDVLASQDTLRDLRSALLSHASQHAQQQLLQPAFQNALLEKGIENREIFSRREELLGKLRAVAEEIAEVEKKKGALSEKRELLEIQKQEIEKVNPKPGEEENLERLRQEVRANASAKQNYSHAQTLIHGDDGPGLIQIIQDLERILGNMAASDSSLVAEKDKVAEIRRYFSQLAAALPKPQLAVKSKYDMDAIEERLFAFAQLKRKLKRTMPEILNLMESIRENLSFLDICSLDINRLKRAREGHEKELQALLRELAPLRHAAADKFSQTLLRELRQLGFSDQARVIPEFIPYEVWPGIIDERGRISWAPNPGQNPQPLDKIASGGELSRFLLAISSLGAQEDDVTFIFDEVDAGVGGLTLNMLAEKLEQLAKSHQVILITHWPQLAARAGKHFNISKTVREGNTYTQCQPLDANARKAELIRMAGGGKEGAALAETLLQN